MPLLAYPRPIVCGHYEVREPLVTPARICLDTAAYRTEVLTALQMETRTLVQVSRAAP